MEQRDLEERRDAGADPDERVIVDRVYSAVMEHRLPPRTKLSEAALCETFGVGRMRVRRSLLLLASQGIVELHSNRGAYVACPTAEEADEVFEARLMIESRLVETMAEGVPPTVIDGLRRHLTLEDEARLRRERSRIIRLSGEFHVELAKGHGNAVLVRFVRELVTRTSLIVGLFGVTKEATCPEDEHRGIVDAVAGGDGAGAAEMMRRHLEHIRNGLDLGREEIERPDLTRILAATPGG